MSSQSQHYFNLILHRAQFRHCTRHCCCQWAAGTRRAQNLKFCSLLVPAMPRGPKPKVSKSKTSRDSDAMMTFRTRFKTWSLGVGSHMINDKERVIWLGERTSPTWGMGCGICSTFYMRMSSLSRANTSQKKHSRRTYGTKWARYQVTSPKSVQASCLRKHSLSELHVAALRALHLPFGDILQLDIESDRCDRRLLSGSVPQPPDWLHAWSITKRFLSSRCASSLSFTDQFICSMRVDVQAIQNRAFSQMQLVMQEAVRRKKRASLSCATSIALSVDDKSPYRIVRYKSCDNAGNVKCGVLCVMYPSAALRECPPEEWDNDKSQMAADSIARGIREFCTPHGQACNEELLRHICVKCHSFTADGAPYAQKVGKVLRKRHCPNIVILFRDVCHMLRISSRDPLFCGETYQNAWATLFDKGSVIPNLQYSPEWRAKLATLNHSLMTDGTLNGVLKSNLKHFGFAKQRWESASTPQRVSAFFQVF